MDGIKIEKSDRIKASREAEENELLLKQFLQASLSSSESDAPVTVENDGLTQHTPEGRLSAAREAERIRQEKGNHLSCLSEETSFVISLSRLLDWIKRILQSPEP